MKSSGNCSDIKIFGNCSLGKECNFCVFTPIKDFSEKPIYNLNAKEFVPKKKLVKDVSNIESNGFNGQYLGNNIINNIGNLNLNAKEFVPTKIPQQKNINSNTSNNSNYNNNYYNSNYFYNNNQNLITNPVNYPNISNYDDINDDEMNMIDNDLSENEIFDDDNDINVFYSKYENCTCCKGYVNNCKGDICKILEGCQCIVADDSDIPQKN